MMSFDNLGLRSKNLIPLGVMVTAALAIMTFGALTLTRISEAAGEMLEHREVGAAYSISAAKDVTLLTSAVNAIILVDDDSPLGLEAQQDFKAAPIEALDLLDKAAAEIPEHADEIKTIRSRFASLFEQAKPVFQAGLATTGVNHGRALKPEDLDALAVAAQGVTQIYLDAGKIAADISSFNNRLSSENGRLAADLRQRSHAAVVTLLVVGLLGAGLAVAFSLWITVAKIERPLTRLGAKMRALAAGDLAVDLNEAVRRDEIGGMARAVEVFKTNAIARRQAEAEAERSRAAAQEERERAEAEKVRLGEARVKAVTALSDGLRRLANGDLTARLDKGFGAEHSQVRDDFNAAVDKLKQALELVVRSTGAIQSSSQEITSASDNLSQRTEQQAASVEETAAALEEITRTVKASAANAQHAADVVGAADSDAKKGAVVVRQAVEAMDAIADSSNKIGQIIGVIDEIAFQTNLLALNAGVEAARAGDSGRGFAVVAMEVRALAQRSAEAAKEIKALVSTSGAQVNSGVKLVAESGKALESIISQVSEINKVVADIAEATQQQATGLAQINTAISQMDQTTQQNATMVEESTAASHSLSKEMGELTRLVEQFRLAEPGEADLRRNLKTAAPHAFAKPAAPPPRGKTAPAPKLARASGTDWAEF